MFLGFAIDEIDKLRISRTLNKNSINDFVFPRKIAHHITYLFPVKKDIDFSQEIFLVKPFGYVVDNEREVEAIIFLINGTIYRSDNKVFHCTWSLGLNSKPMHSNEVIASALQNNEVILLNDFNLNLLLNLQLME